eukprot:TRINITY_DN1264_c8_g1_i1.p1 TRINITY_DN1264_c8_g1~~TRINITY_DN1264_c8_g1_i1.p1  ORF type:complete len:149 (-),score=11.89 TRINITY_DN1264_c8_g1_i1:221-667(-)
MYFTKKYLFQSIKLNMKNVHKSKSSRYDVDKMKIEFLLNPVKNNNLNSSFSVGKVSINNTPSIDAKVNNDCGNVSNGEKKKIRPYKNAMFNKDITCILITWILENIKHPYPTRAEKLKLMNQTGLSKTQLDNWFYNTRRRKSYLKYFD